MRDVEFFLDNSVIENDSSLYYRCKVKDSYVGHKAVIGDFSRITASSLGNFVRIDRNNLVYHSKIGKYTYTGPFDMIFNVEIGNFCSISYGVTIGPPEHDYRKISTHPFLYDRSYDIFSDNDLLSINKFQKKVEIGSDVWIGCNATILRGCKIGHGAVVGANSLVNKDVPPYAIVAGSPAKILKFRFPSNKIEELLAMSWWDWDIERIREEKDLFLNW